MTVLDIVRKGTDYFKKNNISSPRLNIELLICELLKIDRIDIYTNFDKPLQNEEVDIIRKWIKRRKNYEPIEYITGRKKFMELDLKIDSSVLIPRPETELLIMEANKIIPKNKNIDILDIGTGSGCIALQIAKNFPQSNVYAIDIASSALNTASENAKNNKINNVSFKKHNILTEKINYKFDFILSNPPYINQKDYFELDKDVLDYEPEIALNGGEDGLNYYRRFSRVFSDILKPDGTFLLEIGAEQKDDISDIFNKQIYKIKFVKDFSSINRVCIGNFL